MPLRLAFRTSPAQLRQNGPGGQVRYYLLAEPILGVPFLWTFPTSRRRRARRGVLGQPRRSAPQLAGRPALVTAGFRRDPGGPVRPLAEGSDPIPQLGRRRLIKLRAPGLRRPPIGGGRRSYFLPAPSIDFSPLPCHATPPGRRGHDRRRCARRSWSRFQTGTRRRLL